MNPIRPTRSLQGFGLIEVIIVVAIIAITAALALPSYSRTMGRARTTTTTNSLLNAVNDARSEALVRRKGVSICPSTDGNTCAGTDWSVGWIVLQDSGANGAGDGKPALRAWPAVPPNTTLTASTAVAYINFSRMGTAKIGATGASNVSFTSKPTPCVAGDARQVTVKSYGRASVAPTTPCT